MSLLSPALQAFESTAKNKTVHAAAAELHLTQTAVTQRLRTLEIQLKTSLFIRTRRGMVLTPEGEALLRYCRSVREIESEVLVKVQGTGTKADVSLCISGPTSLMRSRIIPQCIPVLKKFPKLRLQFDTNDSDSRVRSLKSGESQLCIIQPPDAAPEMQIKSLKPENYVLVGPAQWKQRTLLDVIKNERIIDYDPSDQFTFNYLKDYALFEHVRHDRHFANRTESLAFMIMQGLGYGLLTDEFSKPYLDSGELVLLHADKIYKHSIALAWYDRHEPPDYFAALISSIE